ncbi:MAG: hypothetical protein Q8P26_01925 [Candidatus Levybacteria bacterium]|nr:hypothetical protein [Candidatus Levybacteria bacterium]
MIIAVDPTNADFDERDLHRIKLLEGDRKFEDKIKIARKDCKITELLDNFPSGEILSIANKYAEKIVNSYGFPTSWIVSISNFIVRGKFVSPSKGIFLSGFAYKTTRKGKRIRATDFSIVVTQRTSFDTLRRWLWHNKLTIERHLKELPRKNVHLKDATDPELRIEIFNLSQRGYKPKKIYKELCNKYPQELFRIPSNVEISKIVDSLKKLLSKKK